MSITEAAIPDEFDLKADIVGKQQLFTKAGFVKHRRGFRPFPIVRAPEGRERGSRSGGEVMLFAAAVVTNETTTFSQIAMKAHRSREIVPGREHVIEMT